MKPKRPKPKFRVGQVVFVSNSSEFVVVAGRRWERQEKWSGWGYHVGPDREHWFEHELRSLTAREKGLPAPRLRRAGETRKGHGKKT